MSYCILICSNVLTSMIFRKKLKLKRKLKKEKI